MVEYGVVKINKDSKLYKFIIRPPLWLLITIWVLALFAVAASITLYFLRLGTEPWALIVYAVALALFILSVYGVLAVVGVPERASGSIKIRKFFTDYGFRATVYAAGSVIFNTLYVAFGVLIAVLEHSPWLGALVGYHVFLAGARAVIFIFVKNYGKEDGELYRLRAYTYCGVALAMLALAFLPVIRLVIDDRNSYRYFVSTVTYVSAIALYTFIKLGVSVHNFRKAHKTDDMSLIAIKNISLADALITLFALQATMLKELGNTVLGFTLNPSTGGLIALVIFGLGMYMFVMGMRRIRKFKIGYYAEPYSGVADASAQNAAPPPDDCSDAPPPAADKPAPTPVPAPPPAAVDLDADCENSSELSDVK